MKKSNFFFLKNEDIIFILSLFVGIFLFCITKLVSTRLSLDSHVLLKLIFYFGLFIGLYKVKKSEISKPLLFGLYFFYFFIIFYIFFSPLYIPIIELEKYAIENPISTFILNWNFYLCILFLILSFHRPLLGLFVLLIFFYKKKILNDYYDFYISATDWLNVYEFFIFFILLIFSLHLITNVKILNKIKYLDIKKINYRNFHFYFFLTCVAIHFSSYFYSGIAKTGLIEHLSNVDFNTWYKKNNTPNIILAAWYAQTFPFASFESINSQVYKIGISLNTKLNFIVLYTQILCIICFLRISLIKLFCIIFDIIHIFIFILTGIFFWKWITLNLIIFFLVRKFKDIRINYLKRFIFIFFVLTSYHIFFVAKLAWFDSKSMNAVYLEAIDNNEEVYRVPSNYFGTFSLPIAQMRLGRNFDNFFNTGVYGAVYDFKNYKKTNQCSINDDNNKSALNREKLQKIKTIVKKHHQYVTNNLKINGKINYDFFAHHIWSNPLMYKKFNQLDKRKIKSYNYIVEAVCLEFKQNKFKPSILRKNTYAIDINK